MIKTPALVVLVWMVIAVVAATAAVDTRPSRFRSAVHSPSIRHSNLLRTAPLAPAPGFLARRSVWTRRLFGLRDVWSWVSDKKQTELLHKAHDAFTEKMREIAEAKANTTHRRLEKWKKDSKVATELGTMFNTLRFIANRIGEVNDKAYRAQEKEAARLAALGSTSSSSSMDADARQAAVVVASRAKAAVAYGLATPSVSPSPTTTSSPPTLPPTPTTPPSVFARMQW
jgi:hypothetical protein